MSEAKGLQISLTSPIGMPPHECMKNHLPQNFFHCSFKHHSCHPVNNITKQY